MKKFMKKFMKKSCLIAAAILFFSAGSILFAQAAQSSAPSAAPQNATPAPNATTQQAPPQRVTAYTLSPARYKEARDRATVNFRLQFVEFFYGLVVLLLVLALKLPPKYRDYAERASKNGWVQALIFAPLLFLTLDVLTLPIGIYRNWLERGYGLSIQSWPSWFWDWTKGEILGIILAIVVVRILYAVIRHSPRRWWFHFWLVLLPFILFLTFLQPFVIDPMFHKFEPLQQKDPALTQALEKMVQHSGESIAPERMFWMGAGEKTTGLNAYVTGFGASKRIVVWDTTIAKMNTPQIVYVAGHEMGHYVLNHVYKGLAFAALASFVFLYLGFLGARFFLARWGASWQIRDLNDLASLPVLLLLLTILVFFANPLFNASSRYFEHQADQYGLEVTHNLTPDASQVAAQAFQILGDVNLDDPTPSPVDIFLFYSHPAIPDRIQFALHYDPWSQGQQPEFVK